jgi:microcystin-dependent protein
MTGVAIYSLETDCEIQIKVNNSGEKPTINKGFFSIQEIGRQIIIDPVEHINKTQGIEDAPVGHIISHMGNNAPAHYLICDGTEYTIEDYPDLAQHFIDEFGSVNCFGGDGVTTFAVPNINKNTSDAKNVDTYGLIPKMSAYSNSTCKVTQGSEYSTYKGYYAFDRNDTTAWISDKSPSEAASDYVQVQFIDNGHRKINKISLRNANLSSYNRCKDFVFQASDDGISFDTLLTDVLPDDSTKYYDYAIASNKTYTIFRIVVKSTYNGGSTYNYGLGDIRLFGTVAFPYAFIKYEPTYYTNVYNPLVGRSETVLFEGNYSDTHQSNTLTFGVTLNDSIENYDELYFEIYSGEMLFTRYAKVESFVYGYPSLEISEHATTEFYASVTLGFVDSHTLSIGWLGSAGWASPHISKVIGVKYQEAQLENNTDEDINSAIAKAVAEINEEV